MKSFYQTLFRIVIYRTHNYPSESFRTRYSTCLALFGGVLALVMALPSRAQPSDADKRAAQLLQQGNYDQAIASYREELAKEPNNYDAHLGVATAQFHKEAYAEAQAGFLLFTRLQPQRVEGYLWQARTAEAQNQPQQALAAYQAALVLQPNNEHAMQAVSRLQKGTGAADAILGSSATILFRQWQFYCLAMGASALFYLLLRRQIQPSNAAKREFAESLIGVAGAVTGDRSGDNDLSRAGRWYAQRHMLESIVAFKIQSRGLLLLAASIGVGVSWICFQKLMWKEWPEGIWIGSALLGCFFLWKQRWTFT